jgi:hypothetical protein
MASKSVESKVSIRFQIITFLISSIVVAAIFYKPFVTFYGFDRVPEVKPFPLPKADTPLVYVGLLVNTFHEFKVETGEFSFSGAIWFQYNPAQVTLQQIQKFHIVSGEIKSISEPDVRKVGDNEIAQFEITASFKNDLNYASFPLDDHYVSIGIFNYALPDGTVFISETSDFDLGELFTIPGWKVLSRTFKVGYVDRVFGKQEIQRKQEVRAFFILECKRTDPVFLITILATLLIIILIAVLSFSPQQSVDLNVIGAVIGFRFVIAALAPANSGYFMISDYLFFFCLLAVILSVLGSIAVREWQWGVRAQRVLVLLVYGCFIGGSLLSILLI